ncbi:MAG: hypothetical protein LBT95_01445 [Treponema sp.]|jgi:hypothetical protein|nr:hypothetical protein [Treponema sp.]
MKIAVRYHSRSGNTKKIAEAIAEAAGADAADCGRPVTEAADLRGRPQGSRRVRPCGPEKNPLK